MDIKFPKVIVKKGHGKFYNSENSYNSDFEIYNYPERNVIITKSYYDLNVIHLFTSTENWRLEGKLDDGTIIESDGLILTEFIGDTFIFLANKEIYLGNKDLIVNHAVFPLIGFYEGKIDFEDDNWEIISDTEENNLIKDNRRISTFWKIQPETRELMIKHPEISNTEDYLKKAISISNLLTIATGNKTTFQRQLYYSKESNSLEIWRKRVDYHFGISSIIESTSISDYLQQTITNYENLNKSERGAINRSIEYINSAAHGYLEDRIFRIGLAWELLSLEYAPKTELGEEYSNLKKKLKKAVKEWNKEYPELNKGGIITDRVTKSLGWEKLISQLTKFAADEYLDIEKIGIDFRELKELRDNVAHTGKFKNKYEPTQLIQIIEKAIFGLRVLILRKLGYSGNIQKPIDNYLYRKDICEFLKPPPNA